MTVNIDVDGSTKTYIKKAIAVGLVGHFRPLDSLL